MVTTRFNLVVATALCIACNGAESPASADLKRVEEVAAKLEQTAEQLEQLNA